MTNIPTSVGDQSNSLQEKLTIKTFIIKYRVLLIFLILVIVASFLSDNFLTFSNVMNVLRQVSIMAIIAAGMTLVILTAGIDLSVGSVLAFSGAIAAGMITANVPIFIVLLITLIVGLLLGYTNGLFVAKFGVPAFITTLALMVIARGLTLVYTGGYPITISSGPFGKIGGGTWFGIPIPIYIMIAVYLILHFVLKNTSFGRYVYAIGGNEEATKLAGVNVKYIKATVYGIAGLLSGLAAIIYTSRLMSAQPTAGQGLEMDAIAAVIIGGTSLAGGKGGVMGTLIGALIIGVLDNILNLMNVSPFYQDIVKGAVILVAVLADIRFSKIKK